jgi:SAM-dependent methyltransferase
MQAPTPADETRARNRVSFDGAFGRAYSYWMERPWLGRAVGFALWGGDSKPYYKSMRAIGELPEGAVVVDAPCGAGAAFAALSPRQRLRYLALDLSPLMLERARQRAPRSDLTRSSSSRGTLSASRLQSAARISSSPTGAFTACRILRPPFARPPAACVGVGASSER